jgi:hypothetical protein
MLIPQNNVIRHELQDFDVIPLLVSILPVVHEVKQIK